jgi:hypothetical protein
MGELEERNDKKLGELTGLDQAVVQRCKKLLDYPKKYQDIMLDPDPEKRVKADFFIELYVVRNDRFVNSFPWYSKDAFTQAMLDRYRNRRLKAVTDFRLIKQHINNARNAKKGKEISQRLRAFARNEELPIDYLQIGAATVVAAVATVRRCVDTLAGQLESLDVDTCYGDEALWKALKSLLSLVRKKLREAGRRIE